jgi:hypothetical protein
MCVLRQLLAHGWFAGTTDSALRVLSLLGRDVSLPRMESSREVSLRRTPSPALAPVIDRSTGTAQWERGRSNRRQTTPRREPILKLFFRFVISFIRLLLFAGLLALIAWWFITTPTQPP